MRERLFIFLKLALFWLAYMILARAVFLLYNYDLSAQLTSGEIVLTEWYGFRMDASMAGYFMAAYGLLLTASVYFSGRWVYYTVNSLTIFLIVISSIIVIVDLELYRHWGFRLNTTPFFYLGSGAWGSIDPMMAVKTLSILVVLVSAGIGIYLKWIAVHLKSLPEAKRITALVLFIVSALMFLPIRGSFTVAPMNTGFVYFHPTKAFANHTAVNVVWNFLYSVRKSPTANYPENFYDKSDAQKRFEALYPASDSTVSLLNTKRPNILFIVLESFTADVVEPLGGMKDIAPNLSQLCREGVLFDSIYSSGDRTDKGIISIFSGYPAQPQTSIIKFPAKTLHLPQLNRHLKGLGYTTSFLYGGDIDFANFRSYISTAGFDHLTTMDDFPDEMNISKWGIHDHFMFEQAQHELDTTRGQFFKVVLTLSSHEPFDVPMKPYIKGKDTESLFLNACHYTDKSLGDFITWCKKQSWWNNTLIILTADHGHRHPGNKELKDRRRFRIPLLFTGGVVKQDTVIHTLATNTDIANTLLAQLDKPSPEFKFSKDIMGNKVVPFAVYFFNDGYGFLTPTAYIIHDNPGNIFLERSGATEDDINLSKAYQQTLYSDYNLK
ncbi:MAG TPA: sulfatase-like hydrolase/transferase [Ohtaekwangia sp.]